MITYKDAIKTLFLPEIEYLIPDGLGHSLPIFGLNDSTIVDNFFIYSESLDGKTCTPPIARLCIDVQNQKLVHYYDVSEKPFASFSENESEIIELKVEEKDYISIFKKFEVGYAEVRKFAFSLIISNEQKNVLAEYIKSLFDLINPELYSTYIELSPSFFKWVKESL